MTQFVPNFYDYHSFHSPVFMKTFEVDPAEFKRIPYCVYHPYLAYLKAMSDIYNDSTVYLVSSVKFERHRNGTGTVMVFALKDLKINDRLTGHPMVGNNIDDSLRGLSEMDLKYGKMFEFEKQNSFMLELAEKHNLSPKIPKKKIGNTNMGKQRDLLLQLFDKFRNPLLFLNKEKFIFYPLNTF